MKINNMLKALLAVAIGAVLTACGSGGSTSAAAPPAPVVQNAAITISLDQSKIALGKSATLTWSTTNATSCTASGAWSGVQLMSGTAVETPTSAGDQTFTLACSGASGVTATQSVTLTSVTFTPVSFNICTLDTAPAPVFSVGDFAIGTGSGVDKAIATASGAIECIKGTTTGTVVGTTPTQTGFTAQWNWNWPQSTDNGNNYVKAVPGIVYAPKGIVGNGWTGQWLDPIKVSDINTLTVAHDYTVTTGANAIYDVMYEFWVDSTIVSDTEQKWPHKAEIYIKTEGTWDEGTPVDSITVSGVKFNVYFSMVSFNSTTAWPMVGFRPATPLTKATLPVKPFFDWLLAHNYVLPSDYIDIISFSTEVGVGTGTFTLNSFSVIK
jgi:hypothetical protein